MTIEKILSFHTPGQSPIVVGTFDAKKTVYVPVYKNYKGCWVVVQRSKTTRHINVKLVKLSEQFSVSENFKYSGFVCDLEDSERVMRFYNKALKNKKDAGISNTF